MGSRNSCTIFLVLVSLLLLSVALGFEITPLKADPSPLETEVVITSITSSDGETVSLTGHIYYLSLNTPHTWTKLSGTIANNIVGTLDLLPNNLTIFGPITSDGTGAFQWTGIVPVPTPGSYSASVNYQGGDPQIIGGTSYTLSASSNSSEIQGNLGVPTVTLTPSSVSVAPGKSTSAQVAVTTNILNAVIDLTVTSCPSGWACALSPLSGSVVYQSTLSSSLSITVPIGAWTTSYTVTVQARLHEKSTISTGSLTVTVNELTEITVATTMTDLYAQYDGQNLDVSGTIEFQNTGGSYQALPNAAVLIGNPQAGSNSVGTSSGQWLGNVTSDSSGDFEFYSAMSLNPGTFSIPIAYQGCSTSTGCYSDSQYYYDFNSYSTSVALDIALTVNVALDNLVVTTIPNGPSSTVTVSVTTNSQTPYTVTLTVSDPSGALDVKQLSATSGPASAPAPFTSKLLVHVSNSTTPGTYKITVTATALVNTTPVSASTHLTIIVQNNTRSIIVTVQGLPSDVQTNLLVDQQTAYTMSSSTKTITISNNTQTIQVTKEIDTPSGDTRYFCSSNQQSTTDHTVSTYTFTYVTQYRLKLMANSLSAVKDLNLELTTSGDTVDQNFNPVSGYSGFYAANTQVGFALNTTFIHTATIDYNFTGWTDASGKALNSSGSSYVVTMDKPYTFTGAFSQWVQVTVSSDLPGNMSSTVQISLPTGGMSSVTLEGGTPYQAGLYPVGSTFQSAVGQGQTELYTGADQTTRYTYQATLPASSVTLNQHTTILIHYQPEYEIQVNSQFPNAVLQPASGSEWASAGSTATVQVANNARDSNWIPYEFSGWIGLPQPSNQTTASFTVNGPMTVAVQWTPNWTYILIIAGVAVGTTVPLSLIGRRKIGAWRQNRAVKKQVPQDDESSPSEDLSKRIEDSPSDGDMKLYNYIIEKGGSISIPDAVKELKMSRQEITESIKRLKAKELLH